jgi:hypothetical protein
MSEDRAEEFLAIAELAEAFTEMVQLLTSDQTLSVDASTIVEFAQRSMPLAQHTGLVLSERGTPRTVAATSDIPEQLDRIRAELGEGPALDVLEINDLVISEDVASDPRWPQFGPRVHEQLGVRSVASYRLHLGADHRAALIFLSDWPYAFDDAAIAIGCIFAAYCSLALLTEHVLRDKLTPRRTAQVHREIGIAVGILLTRESLTTDQAYARLNDASQTLRKSLPEVAQHVVAHRRLPEQ